ncbi:hypothetical protein Taro_024156 [Colocasia esculenta]|uniref:Uncharacterized protein n=1 Tax=Colocasia esculenta TaxID=4460 RepID=A0A843VJJ0_COLES|nr:hypothetical protein [Colocasia esculenta]
MGREGLNVRSKKKEARVRGGFIIFTSPNPRILQREKVSPLVGLRGALSATGISGDYCGPSVSESDGDYHMNEEGNE